MKQVEIPHDYFLSMSKKDYSHFETAIIREFFQNSVDADAKQFVIDYNEQDLTLTIYDDGRGMDKDTLINKLLVMGKSHKTSENAIGAFGHAKILLYFSWTEWEILTQNYKVTGSSHYYTIEETDDYINGTISTIKLTEKLNSLYYHVDNFFEMCDSTCIVYKYNTYGHVKVNQSLVIETNIYIDENFNIYTSNQSGYYIIVRQNGVMMFKEYVSSDKKKMAVVELNKRPEELLLQNRDYFRSEISDKFNHIKRQFEIDSVETFTLNNDKKKSNFNVFKMNINNDDNTTLIANKVITHCMDDSQSDKEINRHRSKRLLNIAYCYYDMIKKVYPIGNIIFGYTKKDTVAGLWRYNFENDENEVYLNIDAVTRHSPNYRKMSIILLNIIMHEHAHAYTNKVNGNTNHNEEFIKVLDSMHDHFWDTTPFTKVFKLSWKNTTK